MELNNIIKSATENPRVLYEERIENWNDYLENGKRSFEKSIKQGKPTEEGKLTIEDLYLIKTISYGHFSRNVVCKLKKDNAICVLRILKKEDVVHLNAVKQVNSTRKILSSLKFPFCTTLRAYFQDDKFLYFCRPFIPGGTIAKHLKDLGKFDEEVSLFFGSQCILALEFLHNLSLVYRGIRPESLVFDAKGYVKLMNFDFCKILTGGERAYTVCGATEYLAPEVLIHHGYGRAVDWWGMGVLLYHLNSGRTPFHGEDTGHLFENIVKGDYIMPDGFSDDLKSIIKNLIQKDLSKRYGDLSKGSSDIQMHPWFKDVNWLALLNQELPSPFIPKVLGEDDTSHYPDIDEVPIEGNTVPEFDKYFVDF